MRFRNSLFRKADNPLGSEFGAISEYSEFYKILDSSLKFQTLVTDKTCVFIIDLLMA